MNENAKKTPVQKKKVSTGKRYRVFGVVPVVVSCVVDLTSSTVPKITEESLFSLAAKQFGGIKAYLGNGGEDKLIGVEKAEETIAANDRPNFDDYMEE